MKDAVGSTMLVYIVIIVVGIVGAVLIASNMYTSAYKAKNNIISAIDRYYMVNSGNGRTCFDDNTCTNSIAGTLKNMGYHLNESDLCNNKILAKVSKNAEAVDGVETIQVYANSSNNGYCVYKTSLSSSEYYYTIVTFSHLNIDVLGIGSLFSAPVYGQTRTYYR